MSWIIKGKILDMEKVSVYAAGKECMKLTKIWYKWEVLT